jgi:hypothetical protein
VLIGGLHVGRGDEAKPAQLAEGNDPGHRPQLRAAVHDGRRQIHGFAVDQSLGATIEAKRARIQ